MNKFITLYKKIIENSINNESSDFLKLYKEFKDSFIAEKNYYYKIPNDKEQLMNDFYLMDLITGYWNSATKPLPTNTDNPYVNDTTVVSWLEAKDIIEKELKAELLEVVYFSLTAEFRHIYDSVNSSKQEIVSFFKAYPNGKDFFKTYTTQYQLLSDSNPNTGKEWARRDPSHKETDKEYVLDSRGYKASYKALSSTGWDRKDIVKLMYHVYKDLRWSSSFGGKAWASIAEGWLKLYKAKEDKEIFTAIDRIYDLQHNTSTVFNKLTKYLKNGSHDWVLKALDRKFGARSPWELWNHASPTMKGMTAEILRALGYGTYEDFVNYTTKELETKGPKEFDELKASYMKSSYHPVVDRKKRPKQDWEGVLKDAKAMIKRMKDSDFYNATKLEQIHQLYMDARDEDLRPFIDYMPKRIHSEYNKLYDELSDKYFDLKQKEKQKDKTKDIS